MLDQNGLEAQNGWRTLNLCKPKQCTGEDGTFHDPLVLSFEG